ncbi:hypothetical protein M7I_0079 [Glarea lozoyensis 74030]|nr:hypothetical protein M7I_0079 [Glarea lozoyensis 74030]
MVRYDNGTCIQFGLDDRILDFHPESHTPFREQHLLIDNTIREIKAVRQSHPGDQSDPFEHFRSHEAPEKDVTYVEMNAQSGGLYVQVPSYYASVHDTISLYKTAVSLDGERSSTPPANEDSRYGVVCPPSEPVYKYNNTPEPATTASSAEAKGGNSRSRRKERRSAQAILRRKMLREQQQRAAGIIPPGNADLKSSTATANVTGSDVAPATTTQMYSEEALKDINMQLAEQEEMRRRKVEEQTVTVTNEQFDKAMEMHAKKHTAQSALNELQHPAFEQNFRMEESRRQSQVELSQDRNQNIARNPNIARNQNITRNQNIARIQSGSRYQNSARVPGDARLSGGARHPGDARLYGEARYHNEAQDHLTDYYLRQASRASEEVYRGSTAVGSFFPLMPHMNANPGNVYEFANLNNEYARQQNQTQPFQPENLTERLRALEEPDYSREVSPFEQVSRRPSSIQAGDINNPDLAFSLSALRLGSAPIPRAPQFINSPFSNNSPFAPQSNNGAFRPPPIGRMTSASSAVTSGSDSPLVPHPAIWSPLPNGSRPGGDVRGRAAGQRLFERGGSLAPPTPDHFPVDRRSASEDRH